MVEINWLAVDVMFEDFESNLFIASEEDVRAAGHEVRVDADDGDILKTIDI